MRLNENSVEFDPEKTLSEISRFIRKVFKEAKASRVVIGLSGGVDSSLTAALCVRALGKGKVLGILMLAFFTPEEDISDASELAEMLGMRTETVKIDGIYEAFTGTLGIRDVDAALRIPLANILARIRMVILYFYANANNYLVAGTGDRSEMLIGYFTKHGDGGADFFPIRHLYKTQVRHLARYLGIPERMAFKPSSPQLYPSHKLSDEVPLNYTRLDPVLVGLFDYRLQAEKVSEMAEVPLEIVNDIIGRHDRTEHKRKSPPAVESK